MTAHLIDAPIQQKADRGPKASDPDAVRRAGLEPVREHLRRQLLLRTAASAAAKSRTKSLRLQVGAIAIPPVPVGPSNPFGAR